LPAQTQLPTISGAVSGQVAVVQAWVQPTDPPYQDAVAFLHRGADGWAIEQTLPLRSYSAGPYQVAAGAGTILLADPNVGHVLVYGRSADGQWSQSQDLVPPTSVSGLSSFGTAIASTDDRLAISAAKPRGSVTWIYERVGDAWVPM